MERVKDVMTRAVDTAGTTDPLSRVAHVLWERDCGVVPVVDDDGRPVAMLTDRDACMAAFMRGRPLHEIAVADVLDGRAVVSVGEDASLDEAHALMAIHQVRRLPVVDADGLLSGVLSLADLLVAPGGKASAADRVRRAEAVGTTLAAVNRPHNTPLATSAPAAVKAPAGRKATAPKKSVAAKKSDRTATATTPAKDAAPAGKPVPGKSAQGTPALGRGLGKGASSAG